jgi:hypothetical protein
MSEEKKLPPSLLLPPSTFILIFYSNFLCGPKEKESGTAAIAAP